MSNGSQNSIDRSVIKPEWFGGDFAGVDMVWLIVKMTHTWDDLIDKDKPVTEADINNMMRIALVCLPSNTVYQKIQGASPAIWSTVISSYAAANSYERSKDEKGIEIGHTLRYFAGSLISLAMEACVGFDEAAKYIPEMWKVIVYERLSEYREEHINV